MLVEDAKARRKEEAKQARLDQKEREREEIRGRAIKRQKGGK